MDIIDAKGKATGKIELPIEVFDAKINNALMAQAVRVYLANQRAGTAFTKTRGEVRGSTRKIYRQKGTGRARHGAVTAPIFVGGGIVFGPKTRDFSLSLSKKMRRKALFSALTLKQRDGHVLVLDIKNDIKPKTHEMVKIMQNLNLLDKRKKADKVLFVFPGKVENIEKAARNIEGVEIERANLLNTYKVLKSKHVVFLKDSVDILSKTYIRN